MIRRALTLALVLPALACGGGGGDAIDFGGATDSAGTTGTPGTSTTNDTTDPSTTGDDGGSTGGPLFDVGDGMGSAGDDGGNGDPCSQAEMALSNQGCLFWAVDLPNSRDPAPGGVAESQPYAVVVANNSSEHAATVEVFAGDGMTVVDSAVVDPEQVHTFLLPEASIDPTQTTDDGVAYRVESDFPLTAYQFNPLDNASKVYSNDATILFPQHVLTTEYTAVTENATSKSPTYISVVATEDDTEVEVFPTTDLTIAGPPVATLDRGQVFTTISWLSGDGPSNGGNLSGSRVITSKPVAVFSGNVSAPVVPQGTFEGGSRICCSDHLEHQLMPIETWGSTYVVSTPAPAYYSKDPARYRITAAFDGTQLSYQPAPPPGAPSSLGAGETASFDTDLSFTVTSSDDGKPFMVTQFLPSGDTTDSLFDDNRRGDPAMIMLPPVQQLERKYVFAVPGHYAVNKINVWAPDGATVQLDGTAIPDGAFSTIGTVDGQTFRYAHLDIGEGPHVMTADEAFGLTVAGYDVEVSYGFTGGSAFDIISTPPPPPQG